MRGSKEKPGKAKIQPHRKDKKEYGVLNSIRMHTTGQATVFSYHPAKPSTGFFLAFLRVHRNMRRKAPLPGPINPGTRTPVVLGAITKAGESLRAGGDYGSAQKKTGC